MPILEVADRERQAGEHPRLRELDVVKLHCSSCRKELVNVLVVTDNKDVVFRYRADCPYCGDRSTPTKVVGNVYIGPSSDGKVMPTDFSEIVDDIVYVRTAL